MIGMMITGHGEFSLGMKQAIEMIAGKQEKFEAVPFLQGESVEQLTQKMTMFIQQLQQEENPLVICCDLLGGTPCKVAMTIALQRKNVFVLAGSNVSLVLEAVMARCVTEGVEQLLEQVLQAGREGVQKIQLVTLQEKIEEGI